MPEPPRLPPDPPRRHESHSADGGKEAAGCLALEGLGCGLMGCLGSALALVAIVAVTVVALLLS